MTEDTPWRQILRQILFGALIYWLLSSFVFNKSGLSLTQPEQSSPSLPPHTNLMPYQYALVRYTFIIIHTWLSMLALKQDMWVYKSESPSAPDFENPHDLLWYTKRIVYDSWDDDQYRKISVTFQPSKVRFAERTSHACRRVADTLY